AGLGHGERADMLARAELGQVSRLLVRRGIAVDLVDAEVRMGAVAERGRGGSAGNLLDRDDMGEIAEPGAAKIGIGGHAEEAECAEFRPQVAREFIAAVYLVRTGLQPFLCKP